MTFLWPAALLLALAIPLGAWLYAAIGRRRARAAAAYGAIKVVADGGTTRARRRRAVVVPALTLLGLFGLVVALARPQAVVALPSLEGTVMLAFDVSASMGATDFTPTRMEAAKAAARSFVERQPASVQVGVVAFSDSGVSVQAATNDQSLVLAAINRLTPQRGTSLGQGVLASLDAIAKAENPTAGYYSSNRSAAPSATPVPAASHGSAVIVLLTDGDNNAPPQPLDAARAAADRGIRIYTVGIGKPEGATVVVDGFRLATRLDRDTLEQMAQVTGGRYFDAEGQAQLADVYANLNPDLVVKEQNVEVTSLVAAASLGVLLVGALVSFAWLGRAP